ncbi:MAG TPA: hypothetical protein VFF07_00565, partial [Actinomycetota bacterium]|nr:hypothetical protein [Actinomycetota bacterium]
MENRGESGDHDAVDHALLETNVVEDALVVVGDYLLRQDRGWSLKQLTLGDDAHLEDPDEREQSQNDEHQHPCIERHRRP